MKKILTSIAVVLLAELSAFAQGTVNFANIVGTSLNAPIFHGDGVTRLSGSQFQVTLLGGISPYSLTNIATTSFLDGAGAGYFTGGTRTIPGVPGGAVAWIQLRAWDTYAGATFEQVATVGGIDAIAESDIFSVVTGNPSGSPSTPPAILIGLPAFSLQDSWPGFPFIYLQPDNRSVVAGDSAGFSVAAEGLPLHYQWRKDGIALLNAVNRHLGFFNTKPNQAGSYDVVISSSSGSSTSRVATLTVTLPSLIGEKQGNNFVLKWPYDVPGYSLESTTNLPATSWTSNTTPPTIISGQFTVTNPILDGRRFYRLNHP